MSSTYPYTVSPASLLGHIDDPESDPHYTNTTYTQHNQTSTLGPQQLLSPYSSHHRSNSGSPSNNEHTPAESTPSVSGLRSDFSDYSEDPFLGVDFNDTERGTPAFLEEQAFFGSDIHPTWKSAPTSDPFVPRPGPPSPQDTASSDSNAHRSPDTNAGTWPGVDSPSPAALAMASPRVTLSVYGNDGGEPVHTGETSTITWNENSHDQRVQIEDALSVDTLHGSFTSISRDAQGSWLPDPATGQQGLAPENRPSDEVQSVNELATARETTQKNHAVASWVSETVEQAVPLGSSFDDTPNESSLEEDNIPDREIPLGHMTVNKHSPGQVYYKSDFTGENGVQGQGNNFSQTDIDLLPTRNWADPPMVHSITDIDSTKRAQPQTSQAAMDRFQRMYQDNASFVSLAATWGTRRRSLPSIADTEEVISGSIFKKLSLNRGNSSPRRPSFFQGMASLVRSSSNSQVPKRKGNIDDEPMPEDPTSINRRESRDSLSPLSRSPSRGMNKRDVPSLNTAIVGMSTRAAAIGASHARTASVSQTSVTSPKSPFGSLAPGRGTFNKRPRSKTDSSYPHIVGMLKVVGGPPVAQLATTQGLEDPDDEDEDDEGLDEPDTIRVDTGRAEDITPTLDGFRELILRLNPLLAHTNKYLVDRLAHQMVIRYKTLQTQKIKHLKAARSGHCPSRQFCVESGGSAVPFDARADTRGPDLLSARHDSSEGDSTPLEGGISPENFPPGIPMPPTTVLPAELECQICFSSRRFVKPSDWTKHVHEDVQPFTCTWDRCREPKIFKRKADWVRHENEGHRHLEWWKCDVDDCKHICYRRDNFLQHLVREHKFPEPRVKTKAAIKKAGGSDPTWQKVEGCHGETRGRPQDEPCRFCDKTFPTWKKLTVHLAKHMEHISLPVLRLVSEKELNEDSIISPVQEPPPRDFSTLPTPVKVEATPFTSPQPHTFSNPTNYGLHGNTAFQPVNQSPLLPFYGQHQSNSHFGTGQTTTGGGLAMPQVQTGFVSGQYPPLPVSSSSQYGSPFIPLSTPMEPFPAYDNALGLQDLTGAQMSYNTMSQSTMPNLDHYSSQGSVSPYTRSPHPGNNNGFYAQ